MNSARAPQVVDSRSSSTGDIPWKGGEVSLTVAALRGGRDLMVRQAVAALTRLAASIALARLLVPEEFGVAAMAAAFVALPQAFGDLGLGNFLVQSERAERPLYGQVYFLNLLISFMLGAAVIGLGALAPLFFGDERVRALVWVSALSFPLRAMWAVHEKAIQRELEFRRLATLQSAEALLLAVFAVTLAGMGLSYWSLVIPGLISQILIAPCYWRVSKLGMIPGWPETIKKMQRLLRFSCYSTANSVLTYLGNNADYLLIGKLLDAKTLGLYTFAYSKAFLFSKKFLKVAADVALPVMSVAKNNPERLKRGLSKSLTVMALFNIPVSLLLGIVAPILIPWLFGNHWEGAIIPFQILVFHVAVNAITSPAGSVAYAIGKPEINLWIALPTVPLLLVSYYLGVRLGGIIGVALAIAIVKSMASLVKLWLILRVFDWTVGDVAKPVLRLLPLAILSAIASHSVKILTLDLHPVACIAAVTVTLWGSYLALTFMIDRETLSMGWQMAVSDKLKTGNTKAIKENAGIED